MKGIILAAGKGTRLFPATKSISKPLLPVYDKPMIYYPLSALLEAGIWEILLIVSPGSIENYQALLGDGSQLGIKLSYKVQYQPKGIADAFILGEEFIGDDDVCLALGDNLFAGRLQKAFAQAFNSPSMAKIFAYPVDHPELYGVLELDNNGNVLSIEEKPSHPKSNYIAPGLYIYNSGVVEVAKSISPSARGELEITSINDYYRQKGQLQAIILDENISWRDTGNADSLLEAGCLIKKLQSTGKYIGCIEEIAYRQGFITKDQLYQLGQEADGTAYGNYIKSL